MVSQCFPSIPQNDGQMSSEDSVLEMKLKGSETVARLAAEIVDIKSRYDKEKSLREAADQKTELLQQENEKLQTELQATDEQVATLRRKVDDTTAAMQELGRENQSLRSQSLARKWAEDHEVRNCMTCHKGFSVTVRKHHCRQCGKIFCAECSSRKALMPFSTKPVRVCETCFEELQG
ncbi:early endosome antigen 1-like isoform X4 [Syngnathus typhle]|uniref:early endosome antigen 1-like isoform X4 n=1 Tax=Syngnathus typhle TaxID=161592 RepID=UPI002A6A9305|nr:early endosome antigen 1-like isoform X4 [Syngnathus typhle]